MQKKVSRSSVPDGPKIRKLREKTGKTQKEFLRGSQVTIRTYQRAEQGKPITRSLLSEIATLLRVPVADIMLSTGSEQRSAVRLQACDGRGGAALLTDLQTLWGELKFDFRVDPYGQVAGLIADVVRFCKMNQASIDSFLEEPEFIEAVGELNTKIAELYTHGVNIYFASYLYWDVDDYSDDVDGKTYSLPIMRERLKLIFSDAPHEQAEISIPAVERKESAYKRANARNAGRGVQPSDIAALVAGGAPGSSTAEYSSAYEDYCKMRKAAAKA